MYIDGHCDSFKNAFDEKLEMNDSNLRFNFKYAKAVKTLYSGVCCIC